MTRRRRAARALAVATAAVVALSLVAAPSLARVRAVKAIRDLRFPTDLAFAPRNRVFVTEKNTGRIVLVNRAGGGRHTFFRVRGVSSSGERGLLSIALHPDYPATPTVYVYVTRRSDGRLQNQILRLRNDGGKGRDLTKIWGVRASASPYHNGGPIVFGPDGMLYAVVGDGHASRNAQQLGDERGKVLRMTPTGGVPPDNPLGGRRVFAYGIRNSFGLAFDPRSDDLWETENGPQCNDELNRIAAGRNYGWGPSQSCSGRAPRNTNRDGPNPVLPKRWYTPTIAPTGIAFCDGCALGAAARRALFFGAINTGQLRRVALTANRRDVRGQRVVLRHDRGIVALESHPNGTMFFSDPGAIYKLVRR